MGARNREKSEAERLKHVYARYAADDRIQAQWDADNPGNRAIVSERRDAVRAALGRRGLWPPVGYRILDVGCGRGDELATFLQWGAHALDLVGVDLIESRLKGAPDAHPGLRFMCADAAHLCLRSGSVRLVLVFTVFSSVLEKEMSAGVAGEIDRVLEPGGFVIWYDTRVRNPRNPNTRPVPKRRIRRLFPGYEVDLRSITLAPPLARRLGPATPALYGVLAAMPFLRTHYLGVLGKPDG